MKETSDGKMRAFEFGPFFYPIKRAIWEKLGIMRLEASLFRTALYILRRPFARFGIILCYHDIGPQFLDPFSLRVSSNFFAEQMMVLKNNFIPISLSEMISRSKKKEMTGRHVAVTFDDAYLGVFEFAAPILKKLDIPSTTFVSTNFCSDSGTRFYWDEVGDLLFSFERIPEEISLSFPSKDRSWRLGSEGTLSAKHLERLKIWNVMEPVEFSRQRVFLDIVSLLKTESQKTREKILRQLECEIFKQQSPGKKSDFVSKRRAMSSRELRELAHNRLFEIGGHGLDHLPLACLPPKNLNFEICASKSGLEALINKQVQGFAFPYGGRNDYSEGVAKVVRRAGYKYSVTAGEGVFMERMNPFLIPRLPIRNWNGLQFRKLLDHCFERNQEKFAEVGKFLNHE